MSYEVWFIINIMLYIIYYDLRMYIYVYFNVYWVIEKSSSSIIIIINKQKM